MTLAFGRHPGRCKKIRALPDRPEDAVLDSLTRLRIPKRAWEEYLSLHLAAMPGWTGYIKWRAHQSGYPWQQQFPIDLVKYLAVRLFLLSENSWKQRAVTVSASPEIMTRFEHTWTTTRTGIGCDASGLPDVSRSRPPSKPGGFPAPIKGRIIQAWEELGRQQYGVRVDQDVRDWLETRRLSIFFTWRGPCRSIPPPLNRLLRLTFERCSIGSPDFRSRSTDPAGSKPSSQTIGDRR